MSAAHAGSSDTSALKERVKIGVIGGELSICQGLQHTVMHVNHIEHAAKQDLPRVVAENSNEHTLAKPYKPHLCMHEMRHALQDII